MTTTERARKPKHPKSCHERALGLLAVRMRSRRELTQRLTRAGFEAEEVDDVVTRLERVGLVCDRRFAEEYAQHAATVKHAGRRAIASALFAKGVARETVEAVLAQQGDEAGRAAEAARDRAARLRHVPPGTAYQRLCSFLLRRGYDGPVAQEAARHALDLDRAWD